MYLVTVVLSMGVGGCRWHCDNLVAQNGTADELVIVFNLRAVGEVVNTRHSSDGNEPAQKMLLRSLREVDSVARGRMHIYFLGFIF